MSALTNISDQLALLRTRLGEPEAAADCRWSPAQLLAALIASRREVAEETRCYPVKDKITMTAALLPASGSPFLISVTNDFINFEQAEYNGVPLRIVQPKDWRDVVGQDDTLTGTPVAVMYHGRKFQLFRVGTTVGHVFRYRGWAYPPDITAAGIEASLTDRAADVCIWHCAMVLKGSDERSNAFEEKMADRGIAALKAQYLPKGTRYVNTGETPGGVI